MFDFCNNTKFWNSEKDNLTQVHPAKNMPNGAL